MAIELKNKPGVEAPSETYPYGLPLNNNGSGNGMPVNVLTHGDFHQYFARMLDQSGIAPNNLPDNAQNGFQYFEALMKLITRTGPFNEKNVLSDGITVLEALDMLDKSFGTKGPGSDLNTVIKPGIYQVTNTAGNSPSGASSFCQMTVSGPLSGSVYQRVSDLSNGATWVRHFSAGDWSPWLLIELATKMSEIGDWNMDGSTVKFVSIPGPDALKFRGLVDCLIQPDAGQSINSAGGANALNRLSLFHTPIDNVIPNFDQYPSGSWGVNIAGIWLFRRPGGPFDSAKFSSTSINRGWVTYKVDPTV
jgi:hypothetical protein